MTSHDETTPATAAAEPRARSRSRARTKAVDAATAAAPGGDEQAHGAGSDTSGESGSAPNAAAGEADAAATDGGGKNQIGQDEPAEKGDEAPATPPPAATMVAGSTHASTRGDRPMRTFQEKDPTGTPSQYQVREITGRGLPVPPTYGAAQALLDSFEPTEPQQRRLKEIGLSAATRGEAKTVIADYVAANPGVAQKWEAENATATVQRRQAARGEGAPRFTTPGMFQLLLQSGVSPIPTDYAEAAAAIDELPPSPKMVELLTQYGRVVPETRAEAGQIIKGLPATPDQIVAIMRQTGGRYAPKTRGDAETWFTNNRRTRGGNGGRGGWSETSDVDGTMERVAA